MKIFTFHSIKKNLTIALHMPPPQIEAYLLKIFGFIIILIFIYLFIRWLLTSQRRRLLSAVRGINPQAEKKDDLSFVVDTFHDLVRQLKDKERELERLRAIAEKRAEDIESYNENILRSVTSGVITFDREGRIITFNPSAERILRKRVIDIVGRSSDEVFEDENPIKKILKESLRNKEGIPRMEGAIRRPDGGKIWLGLSSSPMRDRDGELIGLILVFSDITEIKHLQSRVELKERFSLLGEMSAGISHELRNPMGAIAGFARLLSKRLEEWDERKALAEAIEKEIEGMNRVISEFLAFTRPADLNLSDVELKTLIKETINSLHLEGVKVTFESNPVTIEADEVLLKQAFINLFQNAIEAMPEGGRLKIVTSCKLHPESGEVEIEISDTGVGIPEDKLKKIFLPFFTTKEKGTGLGLSLVEKIILYHGGKIEAESTEGKGTTFRMTLPIKACVSP